MCYTRRKIEGGVGALRESDDTNFLKPNGQSRNLNIYAYKYLHLLRMAIECLQPVTRRSWVVPNNLDVQSLDIILNSILRTHIFIKYMHYIIGNSKLQQLELSELLSSPT